MSEQPTWKCPNCGAGFLPGAQFCPSCGRPYYAPEPPTVTPPAPAPAVVVKPPVPRGFKVVTGLLALCLVAIVAVQLGSGRPGAGSAPRATAPPNPRAWMPGGFLPTMDPNVAYKWLKESEFDCELADSCWGMLVVTQSGCPSSLYVELSIEDAGGTAVGFTNDTVGSVRPGQQARMIFENFETGGRRASISEVACF